VDSSLGFAFRAKHMVVCRSFWVSLLIRLKVHTVWFCSDSGCAVSNKCKASVQLLVLVSALGLFFRFVLRSGEIRVESLLKCSHSVRA